MKDDCLGHDVVLGLVVGRLSDGDRARALTHVADCPECRALVAEAVRSSTADPTSVTTGALASPSTFLLPSGTRVGRYVVLDVIGAGGMGVVYCAYDPELNRQVALKLLRPDAAHVRAANALAARLLREAQTMARLSHPNVVQVHDAGAFGDQVFLAMELVRGCTLRAWLRAAPRSWREVRDLFVHAGRGVAAAHAAGIIHRDFKPENVLVGDDGRVRVTDFGLARPAGLLEHPEGAAFTASGDPVVPTAPTPALPTRSGALVGTPGYMAPEQLGGGPADARSDVFAFCVTLYEALYERRPFRGETLLEIQRASRSGRVERGRTATSRRGCTASSPGACRRCPRTASPRWTPSCARWSTIRRGSSAGPPPPWDRSPSPDSQSSRIRIGATHPVRAAAGPRRSSRECGMRPGAMRRAPRSSPPENRSQRQRGDKQSTSWTSMRATGHGCGHRRARRPG